MKKALLLLCFILFSISVLACSHEIEITDKKTDDTLIRSWQVITGIITVYDNAYDENVFYFGSEMEFFDNGKVVLKSVSMQNETYTMNGTYIVYNEDTIELDFGKSYTYEYKLEDNKLVIVNEDEGEECILGTLSEKDLIKKIDRLTQFNDKSSDEVNYPLGEHSVLFRNGLLAVKDDDKWGYINENGKYVIDPKFLYANDFSPNGLALVEVDGKYGYINIKGEFVIEPKYLAAWDYDVLGFASVSEVGWDGPFGIIDFDGKYKFNSRFAEIKEYSKSGLAAADDINDDKRMFGYINTNGEWVIKPKYDSAEPFNDYGIAEVSIIRNNEVFWGLIDSNGNELTEFIYSSIGEFDSLGYAYADYNHSDTIDTVVSSMINTKGEIVLSVNGALLINTNIPDKFFIRSKQGTGLVDENGLEIVGPMFDSVTSFYEGTAAAIYKNKIVLLNEDCVIIKELDEEVDDNADLYYSIKNGVFVYWDNERMCYYDISGKKLGNFDFDSLTPYLYMYPEDEQPYHLGKFQYSEFFMYQDGYALYIKDNKYGVINKYGEIVAKASYDQIRSFAYFSDLYE